MEGRKTQVGRGTREILQVGPTKLCPISIWVSRQFSIRIKFVMNGIKKVFALVAAGALSLPGAVMPLGRPTRRNASLYAAEALASGLLAGQRMRHSRPDPVNFSAI